MNDKKEKGTKTMERHKTFFTVPGLNMGLFSPSDLARIIKIIKNYDVPAAKITSAQRLALFGIEKSKMLELRQELQGNTPPPTINGIRYVQACPGFKWCKFGVRDSLALGKKIEELPLGKPFPAKVKVGISGCQMCCTEPYVRDLGILASKKGWTLVFGGNGGRQARIAEEVATGLSDAEALALAWKCLKVYQEEAKPRSRTARFMEGVGIKVFKEKVLKL